VPKMWSTAMATVTNGTAGSGQSLASDPLAVGGWRGGDESDSKSDRYLAKRLAAAGADYKGVALTTFLLGAGVAALIWLAAGIMMEHWVVPGGLSRSVRWAWLVTGLVALAAAIIRWVVPLVRYRVNLVYAARAIEREHPELHNDLVNTVLVKAHPEASPPMVVRSLERRTAKRLSDMPVEGVIDRTTALRLAFALAALVGTACLYELFAPKSFVASAARLLAPWASWAAPSRVSIQPLELAWRMPGEQSGRGDANADGPERRRLAIESGAATLVRGRQLVVSADIRGLRRDEEPIVTVTPLAAGGAIDRGSASWQAKMDRGEAVAGLRAPAESSRLKRFAVALPDAARGLDEPVEIVISAGDARSEPVKIAVVDSPSLLVRELRYDYPPYTRRQAETVEWQGDIRAVEGTQVTIVAECNQPLDAAWIDFECDGDHDLPFNKKATDLARVTKSFPLQMNADRSGPAHAFYRLVFRPRAASGSAREPEVIEPMEHRIEVIPDLAPEVSIEEPRESPARVPPGAPVAIRVRALDPDFGLARVGIETRLRGGSIQPGITLLAEEKAGVFKGSVRIVPERLGAGAGSVLEYRAVAIDTRPQTPNIAHTGWQSLEIDASAPPRPPEEPAPRSAGDQGERSGDGEGKEQGQQGQQAQQEEQPSPEQKNQEQKNQEQEQQQQQKQNGQQSKQQQGGKSGAAEGGQQGGKQETPGQNQRGDKQGAGGNQGQGADKGQGVGAQGQRQGGQQSGSQQSQDGGADKAGDMKVGGEQQGGKEQAGKEQAGKSDAGKEQGGAQAGGKPKPKPAVASDGTNDGEAMERILDDRRQKIGEKKPNSDKQAAEQQGDKKNEGASQCDKADGKPCNNGNCSTCSGGGKPNEGAGKPGAGQQGQGKEGAGQQGGDQQGQGQQGAGQPGKGQEGTGQQGADKQGEGQQQGTGQQGEGQQGSDQQGTGQQQAAGEKNGDGAKGQDQQGRGEGEQQGGKEGGAQAGGERGSGEQGGNGQAAGKQPANGEQSGDGKSGEQKPGDRKGGEAAGKQPGGQQAGNEQAGNEQAGNEQAGNAGQSGKAAREGGQGPKEGEASAPAQAGKPGSGSGAAGSGGWAGGEGPNEPGKPQTEGPAPSKQTEWGEEDLRNAKNAADLAIEHLRSVVESGSSDVLDRLGWTREQARAFLERWETMRRLSESDDPVRRGEFERAVRSLGLRPDGVKSSRDVPSDVRGGQSEGRRSRPPSEYREQFKAYTQGTAGE
jgi:hypothetical protein